MTRKEFRKFYNHLFGVNAPFRGKFWKRNRDLLMCMDFQKFGFAFSNFDVYSLAEKKDQYTFKLGNCKATTPPAVDMTAAEVRLREVMWFATKADCQQGNNPMRYENTTATAYVTAAKSDDAISRDYLLDRLAQLNGWHSEKAVELRKLFNMDASDFPETPQGLIDAIKNDKFKLDDKKIARLQDSADASDMTLDEYIVEYDYAPLSLIIFTDLPKADQKGYGEALKEYEKQKIAAKDIVMTAPPADGLKALQALEAWLPTGKAN